jgi:hypothetical protein
MESEKKEKREDLPLAGWAKSALAHSYVLSHAAAHLAPRVSFTDGADRWPCRVSHSCASRTSLQALTYGPCLLAPSPRRSCRP